MSSAIPAPTLTGAEIRREVERITARRHRSNLIAMYGRGEGDEFEVGRCHYRVVPTRSELELRTLLPEAEVPDEQGMVFLVDWTDGPLPLDVACRLARGRCGRISNDARLAAVFGARSCAPELLRTRLAELVLAGEVRDIKKATGQFLRAPEAYRRVMAAVVGLPLDSELNLEGVVGWAVSNDGGPALVARGAGSEAWQGLREELRDQVREAAGNVARLAWLAWEQGKARRFLEVALVLEAVSGHLGRGSYVEGLLRGRLEALAPGFGVELLAEAQALRTSGVIETVVARLFGSERGRLEELCRSAEQLIDDAEFREGLAASRWLPAGLAAVRSRLALALTNAEQARSVADARSAARAARQALETLEAHHLAKTGAEETEARRHAVRLACWLATHWDRAGEAPRDDQAAAVQLAARFADEGGWVDLARRRLHGHGEETLAEAVGKLLAAVDSRRREWDRQFGAGLVEWLAAGRPATEVIPIEQVVRRLAVEFLQEHRGRKLLIVLMDGMSWANAVELAGSLGREPGGWQPVMWRPKGHRATPRAGFPPVFAAVPTLTAVSRAAFFAGKPVPGALTAPTAKDRERWAGNRAVTAVLDGREPVLLLRDQVVGEGGRLHREAVRQIADGPRVVALVVNAIDEHLAGSPQVLARFEVGHIKPLQEIFTLAAGADRAVLLASDHGHVPGELMVDRREASGGGCRWRPLAPGESPEPFELALPAGSVSAPEGADGVAVIWDDRVCYGRPSLGEHGGAALAEVVAPAVLLAPENLGAAIGDGELRTAPLQEPDWWHFAVAETGTGVQPELPFEPEAPHEPPAQPVLPQVVRRLADSAVFRAHARAFPADRVKQDLERIAVLAAAGGSLPEAELARRCGVQPYRVGGLVARLAELCNLEGYSVVHHDRQGGQVVLNLNLLGQLFEVKP